jgi:hypothetical protein
MQEMVIQVLLKKTAGDAVTGECGRGILKT